MEVRLAADKDREAWDAYVDKHPMASPYCRMAWRDAVEKAYGHEAAYFLAEDKGQIVGIFPFIIFRGPFWVNSLLSLPFCDIGGVVADKKDIKKDLIANAMALAEKFKVKAVELRSCQPDQLDGFPSEWHVSVQTDKVRMLLKLPDSSEKLWKGFKSKLRSQVRKAEKNKLLFCWGGIQDLDIYYEVFSRNMRDLGSPVHSRQWFGQILKQYGDNARMGLVFKDEQAVGCGIILQTNHTVSIPWASTLREFNQFSPNMLLYWNFLKFAVDNKKRIFDFGRSTPNEGTYKFKKQWGAEPEQLHWFTLRPFIVTSAKQGGAARARMEQLWAKLPLSVVNFLGPKIRKYISL